MDMNPSDLFNGVDVSDLGSVLDWLGRAAGNINTVLATIGNVKDVFRGRHGQKDGRQAQNEDPHAQEQDEASPQQISMGGDAQAALGDVQAGAGGTEARITACEDALYAIADSLEQLTKVTGAIVQVNTATIQAIQRQTGISRDTIEHLGQLTDAIGMINGMLPRPGDGTACK